MTEKELYEIVGRLYVTLHKATLEKQEAVQIAARYLQELEELRRAEDGK